MKFILLNGPPRSGKDTLAHMLKDHIGADRCGVLKFAEHIKRVAHTMHGLSPNLDTEAFDGVKDEPRPEFNGKTPREEYIFWAEAMKERHGQRFFGNVLLRRAMHENKDIVIVSDSGFRDEALPIVEAVGAENVLLVQIYRGGTSFDDDSRDYVDLRDLDVLIWHAWNLRDDVDYMFQGALKGIYWAFGEDFR